MKNVKFVQIVPFYTFYFFIFICISFMWGPRYSYSLPSVSIIIFTHDLISFPITSTHFFLVFLFSDLLLLLFYSFFYYIVIFVFLTNLNYFNLFCLIFQVIFITPKLTFLHLFLIQSMQVTPHIYLIIITLIYAIFIFIFFFFIYSFLNTQIHI